MNKKKERHILALSGGKDSAALAVYMKEKYPELDLEYVFIDSGYELPETQSYIERIRGILNIEIITIGAAVYGNNQTFEWWLDYKNNYLPSAQNRWCTEVLKIIPYNNWIDENCKGEIVHSYVGLRADEKKERKGNLSKREGFFQHHPFIDDGLGYNNIKEMLLESGIGFPDYYKWRSRSGCYFCFYQSKFEWIGLHENHEELFFKAAALEKTQENSDKVFTWCEGTTLLKLLEDKDKILNAKKKEDKVDNDKTMLLDILNDSYSSEDLDLSEIIRR